MLRTGINCKSMLITHWEMLDTKIRKILNLGLFESFGNIHFPFAKEFRYRKNLSLSINHITENLSFTQISLFKEHFRLNLCLYKVPTCALVINIILKQEDYTRLTIVTFSVTTLSTDSRLWRKESWARLRTTKETARKAVPSKSPTAVR